MTLGEDTPQPPEESDFTQSQHQCAKLYSEENLCK